MPRYKDGTEAKVGDQVVGQFFSTPGVRAGTLISISPRQDSCNAMVAYSVLAPIEGDSIETWIALERGAWSHSANIGGGRTAYEKLPRMAAWVRDLYGQAHPVFRIVQGAEHGSTGEHYALFECADFCTTGELTKVG